jgi:hypothetical protein
MTDQTERVLANIDDAIEGYVTNDYDVSADAMRWTPEPADEEETTPESQPRISSQWMEPLFALAWLARQEPQCSVAELEAWYAEAQRLADDSLEFALTPTRISPPRQFPPCINCGGPVQAFTVTDELHPWGRRISFEPCGCDLRVTASQMLAAPGTAGEGFDRTGARLAALFRESVVDREAARRSVVAVTEPLASGIEAFAALGRAFGAVGKAFKAQADHTHTQLAPRLYGDGYRRHYRSCRLCNPAGNPKTLCIDGSEYRRRRSRRRRG